MIGLDTNVLARYIMQDDAKQSPLANRLVESLSAQAPGFVPLVAVVELAWVLSSAYELDRAQLVEAFEALLRTKEIIVDRAETVWKALRVFQSANADFADCLIERSASAAGCEQTMTFDRGAAKGCGMTLVS
jgi:predicted nucleic-acid-binding protein